MRLLSFLAEIEQAMLADEPSPQGGSWDNTRTVNYHQRLARLNLVAKVGARTETLGAMTIQSFQLADGSACIKVTLSWKDGQNESNHSIYEKPGTDWSREARTIASNWLNGMPVLSEATLTVEEAEAVSSPEPLAATG